MYFTVSLAIELLITFEGIVINGSKGCLVKENFFGLQQYQLQSTFYCRGNEINQLIMVCYVHYVL